MSRAGIVLCGGRSARMGRPKAWLPWFGRTLVEHVVDALAPAVAEVVVVASPDLDLPEALVRRDGVRCVRDREAHLGPLAGLREGLEAIEAGWAYVTSTDTPHLRSDWVDAVLSRAEAADSAVAPVASGHVQVLAAAYPRRAAATAAKLLASGQARPVTLLERIGFETAEGIDPGVPPPWQGVNTPVDYLREIRARSPGARAEVEVLGRLALSLGHPAPAEVPVGLLGDVLAAVPGLELDALRRG